MTMTNRTPKTKHCGAYTERMIKCCDCVFEFTDMLGERRCNKDNIVLAEKIGCWEGQDFGCRSPDEPRSSGIYD